MATASENAQKIGVKRYSPMLHPMSENVYGCRSEKQAAKRLGRKHIFLCPVRHDWAVKGTDQYIRAVPEIRKTIGDDFVIIYDQLGSGGRQEPELGRGVGSGSLDLLVGAITAGSASAAIKSVDAVLDQLALPCFGGIAPEAIAAGVPVMSSYHPESTVVDSPTSANSGSFRCALHCSGNQNGPRPPVARCLSATCP